MPNEICRTYLFSFQEFRFTRNCAIHCAPNKTSRPHFSRVLTQVLLSTLTPHVYCWKNSEGFPCYNTKISISFPCFKGSRPPEYRRDACTKEAECRTSTAAAKDTTSAMASFEGWDGPMDDVLPFISLWRNCFLYVFMGSPGIYG